MKIVSKDRINKDQQAKLKDLEEEIELMSRIVHENCIRLIEGACNDAIPVKWRVATFGHIERSQSKVPTAISAVIGPNNVSKFRT